MARRAPRTTPFPTATLLPTITGVSGSLTHTTTVALVVNAPPDFTLSATPASQAVLLAGSTSYGTTISPAGGFTGPVPLTVKGTHRCPTVTFSTHLPTSPSTL